MTGPPCHLGSGNLGIEGSLTLRGMFTLMPLARDQGRLLPSLPCYGEIPDASVGWG